MEPRTYSGVYECLHTLLFLQVPLFEALPHLLPQCLLAVATVVGEELAVLAVAHLQCAVQVCGEYSSRPSSTQRFADAFCIAVCRKAVHFQAQTNQAGCACFLNLQETTVEPVGFLSLETKCHVMEHSEGFVVREIHV